MADIPVTENRRLCEMYRILLCVDRRYVAYCHAVDPEDDEISRDYIAIHYCLEAGYLAFLNRRGPEFAGDPAQDVSTYLLTRSGERFFNKYRRR